MDDPLHVRYEYPHLCVRCGGGDAGEVGKIVKRRENRLFRFIWEKDKTFTLKVPVCQPCKEALDQHTRNLAIIYHGGGILVFFGILLMRPWNLNGFAVGILAIWAAALIGSGMMRLYKRLFGQGQAVAWPDLCTYEDGALSFRQPLFQQAFLQRNHLTGSEQSSPSA